MSSGHYGDQSAEIVCPLCGTTLSNQKRARHLAGECPGGGT